jgi:ribosomal protein S18 acetylase RimI-like enzyme
VTGSPALPVTALPGRWASEPYLVMGHGRASVLAHWVTGDALVVLLTGRQDGDVGLVGLGPADEVASLLAVALPQVHDARVLPTGSRLRWATVTRGAWAALDEHAPRAAASLPGWSAPASWDEVARTLERAHPTASTPPDDPRLLGWWGVREAGRLVAVVGMLRYGPGLAPHLVSLGVDPDHRGRGLAGAVLGAAVSDGLAAGVELGEPAVWLGLYARNDAARRVYLRHGFEMGHEFDSRDAPVAVDLTTAAEAASAR